MASRIGVDVNRNYDFLWDFPTAFSPAAQARTRWPRTTRRATCSTARRRSPSPRPGTCAGCRAVPPDPLVRGRPLLRRRHPPPVGRRREPVGDPDKNFTNPAWNGKRGLPDDAYSEFIGPVRSRQGGDGGERGQRGHRRRAGPGVRSVAQGYFLPSWGAPYPTSGRRTTGRSAGTTPIRRRSRSSRT